MSGPEDKAETLRIQAAKKGQGDYRPHMMMAGDPAARHLDARREVTLHGGPIDGATIDVRPGCAFISVPALNIDEGPMFIQHRYDYSGQYLGIEPSRKTTPPPPTWRAWDVLLGRDDPL